MYMCVCVFVCPYVHILVCSVCMYVSVFGKEEYSLITRAGMDPVFYYPDIRSQ